MGSVAPVSSVAPGAGGTGVGGAPLSPTTQRWLAGADLARRRRYGQYMTPAVLRNRLVDRLRLAPGMRVLDPGVGTGEFLRTVLDREPRVRAHGWDIDPDVLAVARELVPTGVLEQRDALEPWTGEPFDLVIGNPPYFQFRATAEVRERFAPVISGRPNIFALFFQVALAALRPGGQLAFVVPPSMNNGAYFEALREHVVAHGSIDHLEVVHDPLLFADAQTAVQCIVVTKEGRGAQHTFRRRCPGSGFQRIIFSDDPDRLAAQFEGRRTLHDLGYQAVTGSVVWNQRRADLRREPHPGAVVLVWARNVGYDGLHLDADVARPRYVVTSRPITGPAIVVNRVVGAVGSARLRCALVPEATAFVAENHVNVIRERAGGAPAVGWDELLAALRAPDVVDRVRMLTGNTQLSATELTHLVPLDC